MGRVEENCPSARQLIKSVQQSRRDVGHGIVLLLHCRRGDNLTRCLSVMRRRESKPAIVILLQLDSDQGQRSSGIMDKLYVLYVSFPVGLFG
jgi:hypothetical protein